MVGAAYHHQDAVGRARMPDSFQLASPCTAPQRTMMGSVVVSSSLLATAFLLDAAVPITGLTAAGAAFLAIFALATIPAAALERVVLAGTGGGGVTGRASDAALLRVDARVAGVFLSAMMDANTRRNDHVTSAFNGLSQSCAL